MKKIYKISLIVLVAILISIIGYAILLEQETIRNYHIKDFDIDVRINNNGDMHVKEKTLYRFNGKYNGITISIPTNVSKEYYKKLTKDSMNDSQALSDELYISNGIENVKIYVVENNGNRYFQQVGQAEIGARGVYTVKQEEGITTYTIYDPAKSEDKEIVFEYTLKGVIVQHNDCAELFWNFIGGEVECKIKDLSINIYAPNIINAYTHGNISGEIFNSMTNSQIRYKNVKPGEFVSARVIMNKFSNTISKYSHQDALPIIKSIEESYQTQKNTMVNLLKLAVAIIVFMFCYWIYLLLAYEKEIITCELAGEDFDVLKKYNPMIAACIAQNRGMHARDILAVLIDLINIGALQTSHIKKIIDGKENDIYKLTKNQDFFVNKEKINGLDEIQTMVLSIFFSNKREIELVKRLKELQIDVKSIKDIRSLVGTVDYKLESIGANYKKVPAGLQLVNTIIFFIICIYILIMFAYGSMLSYITLSVNNGEFIFHLLANAIAIILAVIFASPILLLLLKGLMLLLENIRKGISKLAFKLTSKKLAKRIIVLFIIFSIVLAIEVIFINNSNVLIGILLFFSALLVILTDNLMTSHHEAIQTEYMLLKILEDKIRYGSLLSEKEIKDNVIWGRYLPYAIALGVSNLSEYMKYMPDYEKLIETFNETTENGYSLIKSHVRKKKKLKERTRYDIPNRRHYKNDNKFNFGNSSNRSYNLFGGSHKSFSSGGGRFSGGGGRGGGRGAF